jgi:hypothetical protein
MIPDDFKGAARPRSADIFAQIAARFGLEEAVVRAVVAVEANGLGYLVDGRPKILFERHVFHRLTGGRWDATDRDVSGPKAGGYRGGALEYDRFGRALRLDRDAALRSASWGLGQIMGFNAEHAGYDSVETFVGAMCTGEDLQLWAFASVVGAFGLLDELQSREWAEFARGYNGPGYARNKYDAKLVGAYSAAVSAVRAPSNDNARAAVAEVQALLCLAGYGVVVDGWAGQKTRAALRRFQIDHGLRASGLADQQTRAALMALVPTPPRRAA